MRYEYLTTSRMTIDEEYLNKYGEQGWELIQVIEGGPTSRKLIWKREVK